MKKLSQSVLLFAIAGICFAQVNPYWAARYHEATSFDDAVNAITVDNAGNVYVTGPGNGGSSQEDYLTIKYNSAGVLQWTARYNGPANSFDIAHSIAVDNLGNVYVTGYSNGGPTNPDFATVKYNSSGVQQWAARYNAAGGSFDGGKSVAVDGSGNVFVTGYGVTGGSLTEIITIKYNSSGAQQWAAFYDGPAHSFDEGLVLSLSASGNIYVGGSSYRDSASVLSPDYIAIKYNSAGTQQWTAFYNGPANRADILSSMKIDNGENVYLTGSSEGTGTYDDFATVKINSAGVRQWVSRYNGALNLYDQASSIAVDNSGSVYVTGTTQQSGSYSDATTVKYNSSGVQQWAANFNGTASSSDKGSSVAVDSAGNVYITGSTLGSNSYDMLVLKYDPLGIQQWNGTYNSGSGFNSEEGNVITIDISGNIYTAGYTIDDFLTLKFVQLPPIVPALYAPGNDTVYAAAPVFIRHRWFKSPGRDRYRFQLAYDSLFNNIYVDDTTLVDTFRVITGFSQNTRYWWRVNARNYFGTSSWSAAWNYTVGVIGIKPINSSIPAEFKLNNNYPNPFNPNTVISFQLPLGSFTTIKIFDILGSEVVRLVNEDLVPGYYRVSWNASDYPSGVYFCRMRAGDYSAVNKMILTK